MAEQSHREEMNAAIRAQRERQGTARPPEPPPEQPEPSAEPSALARLRARLRGK
ncbi:MAG: hypothetical protein ACRDL2_07200 [Gaiellaceae bacterium]